MKPLVMVTPLIDDRGKLSSSDCKRLDNSLTLDCKDSVTAYSDPISTVGAKLIDALGSITDALVSSPIILSTSLMTGAIIIGALLSSEIEYSADWWLDSSVLVSVVVELIKSLKMAARVGSIRGILLLLLSGLLFGVNMSKVLFTTVVKSINPKM